MRGFVKTSICFIALTLGVSQIVWAAPKATKEEFNALSIRVETMERVIDQQIQSVNNKADKQGLLQFQKQLKSMERELQSLRGENERLRNEVEQMQQRQREMFLSIDKRLQEQKSEQATLPAPKPAATTQRRTSERVAESSSENVEDQPEIAVEPRPVFVPAQTEDSPETTDAYRDAFLQLKQRRYEDSIASFTAFLENHPNSKFSANAQYWLAEANYVIKRYEEALSQFQLVVDRYPTSSKVPDARLKIGYTYYELERWEEARVTLTRLRAQFPNSTVAGLAQQRLERLDREGH